MTQQELIPLDAATQNYYLRKLALGTSSSASLLPLMQPAQQEQAIAFLQTITEQTFDALDGVTTADPGVVCWYHMFDSQARRCVVCPTCGRALVPGNTEVAAGSEGGPGIHVHNADDWL